MELDQFSLKVVVHLQAFINEIMNSGDKASDTKVDALVENVKALLSKTWRKLSQQVETESMHKCSQTVLHAKY